MDGNVGRTAMPRALTLEELVLHLHSVWRQGPEVMDNHQRVDWRWALDSESRRALASDMIVGMALDAARTGRALVDIDGPSWWLMPRRSHAQAGLGGEVPQDKLPLLRAQGFPVWDPDAAQEVDQEAWLPVVSVTATAVPVLRRAAQTG